MKRKLIDFDVFKQIEADSVSNAEHELSEAEDILSNAFGTDLSLHCFGEGHVVYSTINDSYIYGGYKLDDQALTLENLEELVVNEGQEKENAQNVLTSMVEHLIDGNEKKAEDLFEDYIGLSVTRRTLNETASRFRLIAKKNKAGRTIGFSKAKKKPRKSAAKRSAVAARIRSKIKKGKKTPQSEKNRLKGLRDKAKRSFGLMKEDNLIEMGILCENVIGYVDYRELGPTLNESVVQKDEQGNITAIRVPTTRVRNEGKILSFNWKTLNHEVKIMRDASKNLAENQEFCQAVVELKRHRAFSDPNALDEVLESIVNQWPTVIYLTQNELSKIIGEAFEISGVSSYDDEICGFLAEGILRNAHGYLSDRADKLMKMANATKVESNEDAYEHFADVMNEFLPHLDESTSVEMQVFFDLYNTARNIHEHAVKEGDEILREAADAYLRDLYAVCEGSINPDLELAETVAEWIFDIVETNLETGNWDPSNSVHISVNGDNPKMGELAKWPYRPSSDFDGSGGGLQVSDGKNYKNNLEDKMRNKAWGNVGGPETYPNLDNPYILKPFGNYTMKGETGVDKEYEKSMGMWQSGDTWPNLQNPNSPNAETPQSYKMNHGKESDLVVDQ
jgi:hypothetical protein